MMELQAKLENLGLAHYATILHENGFEDWDTVLDITEDDLDSLGFKRGHRRVLQKEIANARGTTASSPTGDASRYQSPSSGVRPVLTTQESFEKRTKRRYRWHPRADPNAPKKPKTAYVNFADHLRSDPTIASLSFVDIAREVGRRWQSLDPSMKQEWENRAAQAMQAYEDRMDAYRLTKQHQDYQDYLETFKKAPGKSARQKIKSGSTSSITSPRRSESSGPERSPSASIDSPTLTSMEYGYHEESRQAIAVAINELSRYSREHADDKPFSAIDLPSETLCRQAIATLLDGGSTIFHLISVHEAESLVHRLYRLPGAADILSLVELCVVTAVGSQFSKSSVSEEMRRRLFATVCYLIEQLTITDALYLRLMRVFLCLAMYSISEKNLSARSFISAGLSIAKLKHPSMTQDGSREDWQKIYRSLIFTQCWASQILGHSSQGLEIHIRNVVDVPADQTIENIVQWQAVRIAIIANEISTAVRKSQPVSNESLRFFAGQLDRWYRELPQEMQLSTLLSSPNGASVGLNNQQTLLLVHIFYLGAIILLYGQPLLAAENVGGRDVDTPELSSHRTTCLVAGEQISKLMHAINGSQSWTPRSWVLIYWAFSACNVLLLGASQALRSRSTNDFDRLISHAQTCLSTLEESCAENEPVAARYLDTTAPIYASLKRLRESPHVEMRRRKSEHKISINSLLASDDAQATSGASLQRWNTIDDELPAIIREVTDLLKEPFGRPQQQQNGSASDSYPTPPTGPDLLFWFRV